MSLPSPALLFRLSIALGLGGIGALAAVEIGIPLPWMLGPMILVTISAILGAPIAAPMTLRSLLLPVLGVALGSGFHPGIFEQIGSWVVTIAILPIYIALALGAGYLVYRFIGKYDVVTAYFSSAPGGLNDMMILGAEAGGIERRIALAHASRILIVVSFISFFYATVFDATTIGTARPFTGFSEISFGDLTILTACAILGAMVARRLGFPAPLLIGPMVLSGIVHLVGWTDVPPPTLLVNSAQLVMGTVVGARFLGVAAREVLRDIGLAAIASSGMIAVTMAAAIFVTQVSGLPLRETILTFAPGGLPEMSLLALAMGADVAFVATIHILRISMVIALAPIVFRLLKRDP